MQLSFFFSLVIVGVALGQSNNVPSYYCQQGFSNLPWFPYRCPPFLVNKNDSQRAEYLSINNNKTVPFTQLFDSMIKWGNKYGDNFVMKYATDVNNFLWKIGQDIMQEYDYRMNPNISDIDMTLRGYNQSQGERDNKITELSRKQDNFTRSVVRSYNERGGSAQFYAYVAQRDGTVYPVTANPWNNNQYNQNGYYGQMNGYGQQGQFNNMNQPKQYCEYGENDFPWFPFRCPPFLANLTFAQRAGYFAIANNKQILINKLKDDAVYWGMQNGIGGRVNSYFSFVEDFLRGLSQKLAQAKITTDIKVKEVDDIVRMGNQTQQDREQSLASFRRMNDYAAALNFYATEGTEAKFGEYIRGSSPTSWYATDAYPANGNFNQNNIYGNNVFGQQGQFNNVYQPKQYCEYGENEFPWFPFRCPPFLANLTFPQRAGYFAIANNKQLLINKMKEDAVNWGNQNGIGDRVSSYFSFVEDFLRVLSQRLAQSKVTTNIKVKQVDDIVRMGNQTQQNREQDLASFERMNDYDAALAFYAKEGTEEKFGEYIRGSSPTSWYATDAYPANGNSNQNNIYGNNIYGQQGAWSTPSPWNFNQYQPNNGFQNGQYDAWATGSPWNANPYNQNNGYGSGQAGAWATGFPSNSNPFQQNNGNEWPFSAGQSNNNPFNQQGQFGLYGQSNNNGYSGQGNGAAAPWNAQSNVFNQNSNIWK